LKELRLTQSLKIRGLYISCLLQRSSLKISLARLSRRETSCLQSRVIPFLKHLKFKVFFCITKESGRLHSAHSLWAGATCTALLSVAFISHSRFLAILHAPPNFVLLFVYMEKKRSASPFLFTSSFSSRFLFSCYLLLYLALLFRPSISF
jgi:hypothetical protein